MNAIVQTLVQAANDSVDNLRERITDVRHAGFNAKMTEEVIEFKLDGKVHRGALRGRNRDLCLGFGDLKDRAIAVRVFIDGDSVPAAKRKGVS